MPSGSVTRANTKISAVDGTAFVDFSTANVLTNYAPKSKLTLTDSAGKKLVGYIKAAGTGETWSNIYTSDFSAGDDGWTAIRGTVNGNIDSIGGYDDVLRFYPSADNDSHNFRKIWILVVGARCDVSLEYYIPSANTSLFMIQHLYAGAASGWLSVKDTWTTNTLAGTATQAVFHFLTSTTTGQTYIGSNSSADDLAYLKNVVIRQLVTPSTTGVTITSTADGTTYNWASKEAGFNYNDASGYTYEIKDVTSRRGMSFRVGTRL